LPRLSLAAVYGGQIATRKLAGDKLVPEEVHYRIFLQPTDKERATLKRTIRGIAMVSAHPKSLAERVKTLIWSVLIRESGF
jgi:hypothetical protein